MPRGAGDVSVLARSQAVTGDRQLGVRYATVVYDVSKERLRPDVDASE